MHKHALQEALHRDEVEFVCRRRKRERRQVFEPQLQLAVVMSHNSLLHYESIVFHGLSSW